MTRTSRLTPELVALCAGVALTLGFATGSPARAAGAKVAMRAETRAMLLEYTARCALAGGQFLEDADAAGGGAVRRYPGSLGERLIGRIAKAEVC